VTTIDAMVQDGQPEQSPPPPRRSRRTRRLIALLVVVVLIAAGYLVAVHQTSDLYALAPGSATPVTSAISVKGPTKTFSHSGEVLFVTVSLRTVDPIGYVLDKLDDNVEVVHQKALVGTAKPSQLNQVDAVQMQTSTQTAVIVALRRLGYSVTVKNLGAEVLEVEAGSPADGHLVPGDVITAIDGTPTLTNTALVDIIHSHRPGDVVKLTVQPPAGTVRTETITLGKFPPVPAGQGATPAYGYVGIGTGTKQAANLPVDAAIDPGNVGGPSAGLAFTLGVINALSAGDLTGGKKVAVTGTIDSEGNVGPVGGVPQKTVAVRRSGAVAFLVPPAEYNDAVRKAGSKLKIIKVSTLDDAINALASLGGDVHAIPARPTTSTTAAAA
jgi:Lon-like protease